MPPINTSNQSKAWRTPYPLTVLNDRYSGTYSGGRWVAFHAHPSEVVDACADDITCSSFFLKLQDEERDWKETGTAPSMLFAAADSPDKAIALLAEKAHRLDPSREATFKTVRWVADTEAEGNPHEDHAHFHVKHCSVSEFRAQMASYCDAVERGEFLIIDRGPRKQKAVLVREVDLKVLETLKQWLHTQISPGESS